VKGIEHISSKKFRQNKKDPSFFFRTTVTDPDGKDQDLILKIRGVETVRGREMSYFKGCLCIEGCEEIPVSGICNLKNQIFKINTC